MSRLLSFGRGKPQATAPKKSSIRNEVLRARQPTAVPAPKQSRLLAERLVLSISPTKGTLSIALSGAKPSSTNGLFVERVNDDSPCLGKILVGDQLVAIGSTSLLGMTNAEAKALLKTKLAEWGSEAVPIVVMRPLAGGAAHASRDKGAAILPSENIAAPHPSAVHMPVSSVPQAWAPCTPAQQDRPNSNVESPRHFGNTSFATEAFHKPLPLDLRERAMPSSEPAPLPVCTEETQPASPDAHPANVAPALAAEQPQPEKQVSTEQHFDGSKRISALSDQLQAASPRTAAMLQEFEAVRTCVLGSFQRIADMQKREFFVAMLQSLVDTARESLHGAAETVARRLIASPARSIPRRLTMPARRAQPSSLCHMYPPPAPCVEASTPLRAPEPPVFASPAAHHGAGPFEPHAARLGAMYASFLALADTNETSARTPFPAPYHEASVDLTGADLKAYLERLMAEVTQTPCARHQVSPEPSPSAASIPRMAQPPVNTVEIGCQTEPTGNVADSAAKQPKQSIQLSFCDEVLRGPLRGAHAKPQEAHSRCDATVHDWRQFYSENKPPARHACPSSQETHMQPLDPASIEAVSPHTGNDSTVLDETTSTMSKLHIYVGDQLGTLGVDIQGRTVNRVDCGIFVMALTHRARASGCLLREKDQIVEINGQPITGLANLTAQQMLRAAIHSGQRVTLGVLRPTASYVAPKTMPAPPASRHFTARPDGKDSVYRPPRPQTQLVLPFDMNAFKRDDAVFSPPLSFV